MSSIEDNIFRFSKFNAHPLFIDQTFLTIKSGREAKTRNLKRAGGPCPPAVFRYPCFFTFLIRFDLSGFDGLVPGFFFFLSCCFGFLRKTHLCFSFELDIPLDFYCCKLFCSPRTISAESKCFGIGAFSSSGGESHISLVA